MPTYEYECKSCGHNFEVFQSIMDAPVKKCPECGKGVRRLIFGGAGVIFKGSGFYVTDSKRSSSSNGNTHRTETSSGTESTSKSDSGEKPGTSDSKGEKGAGGGDKTTAKAG